MRRVEGFKLLNTDWASVLGISTEILSSARCQRAQHAEPVEHLAHKLLPFRELKELQQDGKREELDDKFF